MLYVQVNMSLYYLKAQTGVILRFLTSWTLSLVQMNLENVDTKVIGILRTLNDVRRSDSKAFNEMIEEDYPNEVFQTVITRKAPVGRLSLYGFNGNAELKQALEPYKVSTRS